jgi:hypothetical protein
MFVSKINYLQDLSFFDCSLDFTVIESYPTSSINFNISIEFSSYRP